MEIFNADTQKIGSAVGMIIMMLYLGFFIFRKK